jgi:hypothetical protein
MKSRNKVFCSTSNFWQVGGQAKKSCVQPFMEPLNTKLSNSMRGQTRKFGLAFYGTPKHDVQTIHEGPNAKKMHLASYF